MYINISFFSLKKKIVIKKLIFFENFKFFYLIYSKKYKWIKYHIWWRRKFVVLYKHELEKENL